MPKYTSQAVQPSLIENTTMVQNFIDDVPSTYYITPNSGYVLHDKRYDEPVFDEEGNETGEVILGYRTSTASCAAGYDFVANPWEFYAVLASEVPENQIYGTTEPETETI